MTRFPQLSLDNLSLFDKFKASPRLDSRSHEQQWHVNKSIAIPFDQLMAASALRRSEVDTYDIISNFFP